MKKQKKFQAKGEVEIKRPLVYSTSYAVLHDNDSLYASKMHLLKTEEFRCILHSLLRDFNMLLHLNDQDFFDQLRQSLSLRKSLESCLVIFPRKAYGQFSTEQKQANLNFEDENFEQYCELVRIVLFIYHRISKNRLQKNIYLVYDEWLLDVAKMLDLAAIYGESNGEIVRCIIGNVYSSYSAYDGDTLHFFNVLEKNHIDQLEKDLELKIDFSLRDKASKSFANYVESQLKIVMKIIFTVKDLLFNLLNFHSYFPLKYVQEFASDYKLQERIIAGVSHFLLRARQIWNLEEFRQKIDIALEDIRQSLVKYFMLEVKSLKSIFKCHPLQPELKENAEDTYKMYCLLFSEKEKDQEFKYYRRLINNIIEETQPAEGIFFLQPEQVSSLNQRTKNSILKCISYEQSYRLSKKHRFLSTQHLDQNFMKLISQWTKINFKKQKCQQVFEIRQQRQNKRKKAERLTPQFLKRLTKMKTDPINAYEDVPERDDLDSEEFVRVRLENEYDDKAWEGPSRRRNQLNYSFQVGKAKKEDPFETNETSLSHAAMSMSFSRQEVKFSDSSSLSFTMKDNSKDFSLNISEIDALDASTITVDQDFLRELHLDSTESHAIELCSLMKCLDQEFDEEELQQEKQMPGLTDESEFDLSFKMS